MKRIIKIYFFLFLVAIISACATVVRPNGGPKDVTPPEALVFSPENWSTNMNKKDVTIKFDEYVVLNNLLKHMVISPQMPEKPIITAKGKKLLIELPDSLKENTTYTIFFGDAVVDFTEGIPVHNFSYVFSTGNVIDSLKVEGVVVNSVNHKNYEEIFVVLYKGNNDSALFTETPFYLTKAEPNGRFYLNNLAAGEYHIYALKDANSNYIYDQSEEEVAFSDSVIIPNHPSQFVSKDSIPLKIEKPDPLNLFVFKEVPKESRFISKKISPPHKVQLVFNKPIENFDIQPMDFKPDSTWHFDVYSRNRDTITMYIMGLNLDTINVRLSDGEVNLDTLQLLLKKKKRPSARSRTGIFGNNRETEDTVKEVKKRPKISFSNNIRSTHHFFSEMEFNFNVPLKKYDFSRIELYKERDTSWIAVPIKCRVEDKASNQRIRINAKFEERQKYKLVVRDSTFHDLYYASNDSIEKVFSTTEMREYGSLKLDIKYEEKYPLIVQLLNSKEGIVKEQIINSSEVINYPYLVDGKYKIKAIIDKNKNGKWDTGDLYKKILPETIYYLNKTIDIRANWDNEQNWEVINK